MARMNYARTRTQKLVTLARRQARDEAAHVDDITRPARRLWHDGDRVAVAVKCRCGHRAEIVVSVKRMRRGLLLRCSKCGERHRL